MTTDGNGLNNGVFLLRVCAWSIEVMAANTAYRTFHPDEQLTFQDQSALSNLFHMDKFSDSVVYYPQRWFNAYQAGLINETLHADQVRRGDLIVHFAGVGDKNDRMNYWCDIAEKHSPDWEVDAIHTSYPEEVAEYWREKKGKDIAAKEELERARQEARKMMDEVDRSMVIHQLKLSQDEKNQITEALGLLKERLEQKDRNALQMAMDTVNAAIQRLRTVERETRKEAIKVAHAAIADAEKMGISTDYLRDMLVDASNWESIEVATKDLQGKVDLEKMKEKVIAEVQSEHDQNNQNNQTGQPEHAAFSSSAPAALPDGSPAIPDASPSPPPLPPPAAASETPGSPQPAPVEANAGQRQEEPAAANP